MDIRKSFADPENERAGVWVDYRDGSRVKIARAGNSNFSRLYQAKMKPYSRQERAGTLDESIQSKILCDVLAETVLLGWEGFEDNGKALKYSAKAASEMLLEFMDFRNEIVELATTEEIFHQEHTEDSEKN